MMTRMRSIYLQSEVGIYKTYLKSEGIYKGILCNTILHKFYEQFYVILYYVTRCSRMTKPSNGYLLLLHNTILLL